MFQFDKKTTTTALIYDRNVFLHFLPNHAKCRFAAIARSDSISVLFLAPSVLDFLLIYHLPGSFLRVCFPILLQAYKAGAGAHTDSLFDFERTSFTCHTHEMSCFSVLLFRGASV